MSTDQSPPPADQTIISGQLSAFNLDTQRSLIREAIARWNDQPGRRVRITALAGGRGEPPLIVVAGEILVRGADAAQAHEILKATGVPWVRARVSCPGGHRLDVARFTADVDTATAAAAVDLLWDNHIAANFAHLTPSGPYVKNGNGTPHSPGGIPPQWQGRSRARAGTGVTVAVIDTGINCGATDWGKRWLHGIACDQTNTDLLRPGGKWDVPNSVADPLNEGAGHGTFVAGVIRQIAPNVHVRCYRALNSDGLGTEIQVACAILQAAADGARIINLSLGTETYKDRPPVALQAALEALPDDVVVVAAAGNQGSDRRFWPAAFKRVIAVAALTVDDAPASWSNRGSWVDFSIRGEGVVSTYVVGTVTDDATAKPPRIGATFAPSQPWAIWSGTSFAAPQVSAMIAIRAKGRSVREAAAALVHEGAYVADYGHRLHTPLQYTLS